MLHAKAAPTFVSDAMPSDVERHVAWLEQSADAAVREVGRSVRRHQRDGRLVVEAHAFYNSTCAWWEAGEALMQKVGRYVLALFCDEDLGK